MVVEMYNSGLLCKCRKTQQITVYNEDGEKKEMIVKHAENCEGKENIKQLLGFT